jgi:hypothetical protein
MEVRMLKVIGIAVLVLIVLAVILGRPSSQPLPTSAAVSTSTAPAPPAPAVEKRFEGCRAKLKQAKKLDVLHDLDWQHGSMPRVVAGPTFFTIPIDAKEGFADTVNCFLMSGEGGAINFDILDWRTGKVAAKYSLGRLEME